MPTRLQQHVFFFFHDVRVNKSRTAVSKCSHDGPTFINTPIERKKKSIFSHQFLYKNAMERASRDVFLKNTKGEDKPNARKEKNQNQNQIETGRAEAHRIQRNSIE
jgi:hypothetical protein